jgi:hypothetical protein
MDESVEAFVGLVATRGDAFELAEMAEEILEGMAPAIASEIGGSRCSSVCLGRVKGQNALLLQSVALDTRLKELIAMHKADPRPGGSPEGYRPAKPK